MSYVEDVEEHRANKALVSPVQLDIVVTEVVGRVGASLGLRTCVLQLESQSAAPNGESQHEQNDPAGLRSDGAPELPEIEAGAKDPSTPDL